jgi:hypothetical protein
VQKKQDRPFLFLRLFLRSWQMLPVRTLLLSDQKVDLLSQLREQIHLISRFLAALRLSAKPFSRNFGMTHVFERTLGIRTRELQTSESR